MSNLSPESRTALIVLIVILCLVIFFVIFFLFVYFKNKKIKNISRKINKMNENIGFAMNNISTTISRFRAVSKTRHDYKSNLEELIKIDNKIKKIYNVISPLYNDLNLLIHKFKLFRTTDLYKKYLYHYELYKKEIEKFNLISNNLNKHWNIIDKLSADSTRVLVALEAYINKKKNDIPISYNSLFNDLNTLKQQTFEFEEKKLVNDLADVSSEINQHEKRINLFARKVDHIVRIENATFKMLPILLQNLLEKSRDKEKAQKMLEKLKKIQQEYLHTTYQKLLDEVKHLYKDYLYMDNFNKAVNEFNDYLKNQFDNFEYHFNIINKQIDLTFMIFDDNHFTNNSIKQNFLNNYNAFKSLIDDFNTFKNKIKNNDEISFFEFQIFLENYRNIIMFFNDLIYKLNFNDTCKNYNQFYIEALQSWTYKILNLRGYFEKSSLNDSRFKEILVLKNEISSQYEESKQIDIKSENYVKWNNLILELYEEFYKQYSYKKMVEILMLKIAPKRSINNSEFNEIMLYINRNIISGKYKEAFEMLVACIKGKKY
ncbi:hypothetical protein LAD74_02945 [Mycoplasma sp. U97]|uniref:hypothetical protein n=1 Tax=Mycoplasma tauri TaxID=547987 RepID=UPI001CBCDC05|nr:hypothetical protein [Mycoplasma tauri]MBZ4212925.1 hypothetical protein [Mycoplasma tauri]